MKFTKAEFLNLVKEIVEAGGVSLKVTYQFQLYFTELSYFDRNGERKSIQVCKSTNVESRMNQVTRYGTWLNEIDMSNFCVGPTQVATDANEVLQASRNLIRNVMDVLTTAKGLFCRGHNLDTVGRNSLFRNLLSSFRVSGVSPFIIDRLAKSYPYDNSDDNAVFVVNMMDELDQDNSVKAMRGSLLKDTQMLIALAQKNMEELIGSYAPTDVNGVSHPRVHFLTAQKRLKELNKGVSGIRL
ncbi:hypothetical protein FIP36_16815 [Salmonella enterica]|nr:hypothetical protein [Salmonella enterica]